MKIDHLPKTNLPLLEHLHFKPNHSLLRAFCTLMLTAAGLHFTPHATAFQETLSTPYFNGGDGAYTISTLGGQMAAVPTSGYLYYRLNGVFPTASKYAYLKISYYDNNTSKTLGVQYDGTSGAYTASTYHTRSSCEGINAYAISYHRLAAPLFSHRENGGTDFRVAGQVPVKEIVVQDTPFSDPMAQKVFAIPAPWTLAYSGTSRNDVNADTIKGKILAGYQGWFRTVNDLYDGGFSHWTTDQWPDPSDYDAASLKAMPGVTTLSGSQAYVFSAADPLVVRRHFNWMRKYNIDGIYLQRFAGAATAGANPEWVLDNVRDAANQEGRVWAIEYDISGGDDATLYNKITADWKWLVDTCHITTDARYLYENGNPVVVIWGAGIRTNISATTLNNIVDFFHNDPVYGRHYVVGCVNQSFPTAWESNYAKYDSLFVWQGGIPGYQRIAAKTAQYGSKAQMHVWPGFSWCNLQQLVFPAQYTDRQNGAFYWNLIYGGLGVLNPEAIFVGMFDEYNEGTAIMPMSDDPPRLTGTIGHYVTNAGSSKDWWMVLSGYAQEVLNHQVILTGSAMPTPAALANRSNIGDELTSTLGATNTSDRLTQMEAADGTTTATTLAGVPCRRATNYYMYFKVDDSVIFSGTGSSDVTIIVDYYDHSAGFDLGLQYDSSTGPWTVHPKSFNSSATNTWRSARFETSNAFFANRENGADFRLKSMNAGHNLYVSRVRVILPDGQSLSYASTDIGSVGIAGSSSLNRGTWTQQASGSDIWGSADAFRYTCLPASGDCSLVARVVSVANTNVWAKAGVMIRESLAPNSKHALMCVTPGSGCSFQRRTATGGTSLQTTVTGTAPSWVKISRRGDLLTSYTSADGVTWTKLGSETIPMTPNVFIGLAITSHNNTALTTAILDNVSVSQ